MRLCHYIFPVLLIMLAACEEKKPVREQPSVPAVVKTPPMSMQKLSRKVKELREYARRKGYNTRYACFIDFGVFSGNKRFVFFDLEKDKPVSSALVCHGQGPDYRMETVPFSNTPGSLCSSPGRYRIGGKYSGRFGTAYKLHGLDESNSNAFERFVVLHGHSCVPMVESEGGICRSDGCPTLNPRYFSTIQPYLDKASKPVLLWVYR
ncbi:murein L,D-transpeptidase catalytic domain-containing protein [Chitinophaga barathri]|uniref:Peptidase n=1 Tax=Chitinophaga barathri TaxID=1647451 RepID=A0A3N4MQ65_9BACT|nr:murein L,D-transpeptidase catalytic domain family protein [Chitinophaga barathri]RPD41809.1 hypothetical protein EG028_06475 [Chitinophaga barathri]